MDSWKNGLKKWGVDISAGVLIAIVVLIVGLIGYLTLQNLKNQRISSLKMLEEKGAALIRSFEAGTRSGMVASQWGTKGLERLLFETGQQPDIAYILVMNRDGTVIAHNDPEQTGEIHQLATPFDEIVSSETVHSSLVEPLNVFEVYKKFTPAGPLFRGMVYGHGRGGRWRGRHRPQKNEPMVQEEEAAKDPELVIFVGLKLDAFEKARRADTYQAVTTSVILLFVGISGSLLIYLFQGYQSATSSLSKEKALSHTIVRNMPTGLITLSPEKKVTSSNDTATRLLELLPDAHDLSLTFHSVISQIKGKHHVVEKEVRYEKRKGESVELQLSATRLFDDRDRFLGYVLLIKDLSEIRALKEKVEKNRTLAAIGRLAGGLAHEIRNPLSSLKGFALYFKERSTEHTRDWKISEVMIREVDRLNRVIDQLLDLSRPVRLSRTKNRINTFMRDSVLSVEPMAAEREIVFSLAELKEDLDLDFDMDKIQQALLNIYLNAMESMGKKGEVKVFLKMNRELDMLEIHVKDQGKGIEKKDLSHIFDPYYTTKSTGTGIGLATVHNIVSAHQGTLQVKSKPAEGTEMILLLPVEGDEGIPTV